METAMTKDELIQGFIALGFSLQDAHEAAAIELGDSKGDCVALDSVGKEYSPEESRRLRLSRAS
jgi:hypothetical protein